MSAPGEAIRDALIAAMRAQPALAGTAGLGVEPGIGTLPRITVDPLAASDWGTKTEAGRELRSFVTLRVAKGQAARLPDMVAAVESAGVSLMGVIDGWAVASAVLIRSRFVTEADGVRAAQVEHRVRVLAA